MKAIDNNACPAPKIGNLIARYELDLLDSKNCGLFEDHLMGCPFCRTELAEMLPEAHLLRRHRNQLKQRFMETATASFKSPVALIIKKIHTILDDLARAFTQPLVYAPALATVVVIILLVVLRPELRPNPYISSLAFEPLPYRTMVTRGNDTAESQFGAAMDFYNRGEYRRAAAILEKIVARQPDRWVSWLYLGISYYMERQPKPALKALTRADGLSKYALKSEIRWYLMQSYLLDRNPTAADSLRRQLSAMNSAYAVKADSLWSRISDAR